MMMRSLIAGFLFALTASPLWAADIKVKMTYAITSVAKELSALSYDEKRSHVVQIDPRSIRMMLNAKKGDRIFFRLVGEPIISMTIESIGKSPIGFPKINGTSDPDYKGQSYLILQRNTISGAIYAHSQIYDISFPRGKNYVVFSKRDWSDGETESDYSPIAPLEDDRGGETQSNTPALIDLPIPLKTVHRNNNYMEIGVTVLITYQAYAERGAIIDDIYIELDRASYALFNSVFKQTSLLPGLES